MPNRTKRNLSQQTLLYKINNHPLVLKIKLYLKKRKDHRLYPFFTALLGVVGGMLISQFLGVICLIFAVYLALVIYIPWDRIKVNKVVSKYGFTALVCIIFSMMFWNNILAIFPSQTLVEKVIYFNGSQQVSVSLGNLNMIHSLTQLNEESQTFGYAGGYVPIKIYADGSDINVDVTIYDQNNSPAIKIIKNVVSVPKGWDYNYDDKALEIVNSDNIPVFQLIKHTPYEIEIKGVFPFDGAIFISDAWGARQTSSSDTTSPIAYTISSIFKYPSSQNMGKRSNSEAEIWKIR
jgi:hypothetical protein